MAKKDKKKSKKAVKVAPKQEPVVQQTPKQVEQPVVVAPAPVSAPIAEKPTGTRGRPRKPAIKHPVSLRFEEAMLYRIKILAARWGITQTRVLERLVDEAWAREGVTDDYTVDMRRQR